MKKTIFSFKTVIVILSLAALFVLYQFSQSGRYRTITINRDDGDKTLILDSQTGSVYRAGTSSSGTRSGEFLYKIH